MTVVFCDIDGVLNSAATWGQRPHAQALEPRLVQRLDGFCREVGAVVVVSSTWRLLYPYPELAELLRAAGLTVPIVGVTPQYGTSRAAEIQEWVWAHPEVEAFLIFDDGADAAIPGRFVLTESRAGLTELDVELARALLARQRRRTGGLPAGQDG